MNLSSKSILLRHLGDIAGFFLGKLISEIHEYSQKIWEILFKFANAHSASRNPPTLIWKLKHIIS